MIRTLIFGAIAGIVGKKLYDSGKLDGIKDEFLAKLDAANGAPSAGRPATAPAVAPATATGPTT